MARITKYKPLHVVQGYTSYGWEDETAEEDIKEARARLKEYRENQPEVSHRLITRRDPNPEYLPARIFCGKFATGLSYADREKQEHGNYKALAFISFSTLILEIKPDCPPEFAEYIRHNAGLLQNRRGQEYPVDSCGHTVTLGGK